MNHPAPVRPFMLPSLLLPVLAVLAGCAALPPGDPVRGSNGLEAVMVETFGLE